MAIEVWGEKEIEVKELLLLIRGKFHGISAAIKVSKDEPYQLDLNSIENMIDGSKDTQRVIELLNIQE